jgi:RNA-directed DNA polymerase
LGNVDLPSVRDRGLATEVQPRPQGQAPLRRYGDDGILGFEREDEARRVMAVLGNRCGRFGRARPPDTTRRWPLWRPPQAPPRGNGPATFDCLGLPCSWTRTRKGPGRRGCQTRRASLRRAQQALDAWGRRHRQQPVAAQPAALGRRWRGPGNDVGVRGHVRHRLRLVEATKRAWYTWRCRRSQRQRLNGKRCTELLRQCPLPRPRITVQIWGVEPRATSTEEPDGGNLLVRIWRGAGTGNRSAYSTDQALVCLAG